VRGPNLIVSLKVKPSVFRQDAISGIVRQGRYINKRQRNGIRIFGYDSDDENRCDRECGKNSTKA
jgi:hypothetical protein